MTTCKVFHKRFSNRILAGLAAAAGLALPAICSAGVIADWTFESETTSTAGPFIADIGNGSASGFHASSAAVYSSPAGNGSPHSFSSNTWAVGDYYQFQVSTAGLDDISLTYDQTGSGTGPGSFQLEYSTNGTDFTNIGSPFAVLLNGFITSPSNTWSATNPRTGYTTTDDLSSIGGLNEQSTVFFRFVDASTVAINGTAVGSSGTDRLDNVIVQGTAVPEPTSLGLMAMIAAGGLVRRRRTAGR